MAFQTGTQVNAALGRTDYTPFLQGALQGAQAQGRGAENIAQGLAGLGQQAAAGMREQYKEAKELKLEERKYKDTIASGMKVLEVLSKTPDIPDSVKKLLPGFTQGLGNPNVSLSEQAANANMLTNIFGAVLSSGLKTTMENSADNAAARYANAVTESQGRDFSMINEVSPTAKLRGQQLAANLAKTKSETFENLANRTKPVALSYSTADDARKAGEAANPGLVVEVKPAPGGGFTFNSGQALLPNKEAEGRLESFNKEIDRLVLTGESARQVAPAVESLLGSLESGSLKTGFAEGAKAKMRSVGKSIGFPVDETALANTEQATAMFGQMILQYYDRTKGGISNAENVLFQSFGPEIGKSEAANKAILTFSKKRGQLDRNLEGIARSYRMGEINQKEAQKQISSTYKKYDEDITSLIPDSPAATPDKYVVGQTYKDANGNTAVYQGKGVFK
jgi:hypothetical protein